MSAEVLDNNHFHSNLLSTPIYIPTQYGYGTHPPTHKPQIRISRQRIGPQNQVSTKTNTTSKAYDTKTQKYTNNLQDSFEPATLAMDSTGHPQFDTN